MGDCAAVVEFGKEIDPAMNSRVLRLKSQLDKHPIAGVIEAASAYATLAVYYDPLQLDFDHLKFRLQGMIDILTNAPDVVPVTIKIPVVYGGDSGPDLEFVARRNSLTTDEVIEIHSGADYLVYMIGFAPGFPYLGGMSERIATPRRESPRLKIPIGSVGIAGKQTGVYPIETPGGWQLIGQTPLELFRPACDPPTLLHPGDHVRFCPISHEEFLQMKKRTA